MAGLFGGRDVVEGSMIDVETVLLAHRSGESEEALRGRLPLLPLGAMEAALAWASAGRPRGLRVVLTGSGHVVEGTDLAVGTIMAMGVEARPANGMGGEAWAAVGSWIDSYSDLGSTGEDVLRVVEAGAEVWARLSEEERAGDPQIVTVSPCERIDGRHSGYCALVWVAASSTLRIVPVPGNGPWTDIDEAAERARLVEMGRTILITWHRPDAAAPVRIERPVDDLVDVPSDSTPTAAIDPVSGDAPEEEVVAPAMG